MPTDPDVPDEALRKENGIPFGCCFSYDEQVARCHAGTNGTCNDSMDRSDYWHARSATNRIASDARFSR